MRLTLQKASLVIKSSWFQWQIRASSCWKKSTYSSSISRLNWVWIYCSLMCSRLYTLYTTWEPHFCYALGWLWGWNKTPYGEDSPNKPSTSYCLATLPHLATLCAYLQGQTRKPREVSIKWQCGTSGADLSHVLWSGPWLCREATQSVTKRG